MSTIKQRSTMRDCQVHGCTSRHSRSYLMCRKHWLGLPKAMRDEHWRVCKEHGFFSDEFDVSSQACFEFWSPEP